MIRNVIVLGGGSAGLMTALALQRHLPQLKIRVVRSPDIGVIGVGESTTPQLPQFLFEYLGIKRKQFFAEAHPTWKTGIHFLWGPRKSFEYAFDPQLDVRLGPLSKPNGFYCDETFDSVNLNAALMTQGRAFGLQPNGAPDVGGFEGFHLYNPSFVKTLEAVGASRGIEFIDAKITDAVPSEAGIQAIVLENGQRLEADFFVDASGFRSELLGQKLGTPFVSFDSSLFTDRAIVGSWDRTDEFIYPYTVAETMEAGWCWQIDHEHAVNRGYVYSSRFISDEQARDEFLKKNPKATTWDRPVKFRSGRYKDGWVGNVFGIGNACGFVEPLEATALMVASSQIQTMVTILIDSHLDPQPRMKAVYNDLFAELWDGIRDFLSIHYRFNTRLQNKFWATCQNEVDVAGSQPLLDLYQENGPTGLCRHMLHSTLGGKTQFGLEGFLVMLVGQKVPYEVRYPVPDAERAMFQQYCADNRAKASKGMSVAEALKIVKGPNWQWFGDK